MIASKKHSHIVENTTPLPPCWQRIRPTQADSDKESRHGIYRIGPGRHFHQALLQTIHDAREVVLLSSFLLADKGLADALLQAADRGVRVYVLTASEHRLKSVGDGLDDFDQRMAEEHKRLLDRLADRVLLRSAGHFHGKFLVADPKTVARGWLSTANFNRALVENVELGIELDQAAAKTLAGWFSWVFWMEAQHELAKPGRLAGVNKPPAEPLAPEGEEIFATTNRHHSLRDKAISLIAEAKQEIIVSSYGWDLDHAIVTALLGKARFVKVTVLTRPRPAIRDAMKALAAAGVAVLAHDKLHAKAIVTESGGLVFTANLGADGLDHGFEVGVSLSDQKLDEVRQILNGWIADFPWRFALSMKPSEHCGEICLAHLPLKEGIRTIVEEKQISYPPVTAKDALDLDAAAIPKFNLPGTDGTEIAARYEFVWEVRAPQLPAKAKELKREVKRSRVGNDGKLEEFTEKVPYEPPAFEHDGQRYVLWRTPEDTEPARKLATELKARVVVK